MRTMNLAICRGLMAVTLCCAIATPSALAKRKKKNGRTVVAIFVVAKGKPNRRIYGTIAAELTKANRQLPHIKPVWGKHLKRVIRKKPDVAIKKCGANIKCIARLGNRAGAAKVLYARAQPLGKGVKTQFLVVDVAGQTVDKRVEMEVTSAGNVAPILATKLDEMFVAEVAAQDAGGEDELSLDTVLEEPPLEVALGPEPAAEPEIPLGDLGIGEPTASELAAGDLDVAGLDVAGATESPILDPVEPEATTEIAALEPEVASGTPASPTADSGGASPILTYAGIGVAGLGAAALGAGGFFGMQSRSKRDEITYGAGGTSQIDARALNKDANDLAGRANLMYGVGGGLLLVGATLVVLDLVLLGGSQPSTRVGVGANAASLVVGWEF